MGFFPELWGAKTLEQMKKELETKQRIVNSITDYTPFTVGKNASKYNGPYLGGLSAVDLPASDSDINSLVKGNITISFDEKKGVPFIINDIDEAQSNIAMLNGYTEIAKDSLLDTYDEAIIKEIINNVPSGNRKNLADDTNNKLTKADILTLRKALNDAKAPLKGRFLVVNPDHESDLYDIADFVSRDKIADTSAMKEGVIGRILGFDVLLYSDMPKVDDTGVINSTPANNTKKVCVAYSKLACGFGRQKEFGAKTEDKALVPGTLVNIYSVFGEEAQLPNYSASIRDN